MLPPRWHAARRETETAAPGLAGWMRRLGHAAGATRRALDADLKRIQSRIEALRPLDDSALQEGLDAMRAAARLGRLPLEIAPEVAAAGRESRSQALALLSLAAERSLQSRPDPRQLSAASAMYAGLLVELPAGEGKTLAAALAAILHAWRGYPCHVAVANDYLARRDAERMRPLYARCGLAVAAVAQNLQPEQSTQAYRADVVYGAGKQLLADYLRDQLLLRGIEDPLRMRLRNLSTQAGAPQPMMRGLGSVIVDDAETVLFDEATSPVVVSAPSDNPMLLEAAGAARELINGLQPGSDYLYRERQRDIVFSAAGEAALERLETLLPPLWRSPERRDDLVRQAIMARDVLQARRHYVVQQGRLVIVDDYLGRLLYRPAWTQGLQQALEIKEGLEPTPPSRVLARMSVGRFFRRYHQLGGIGSAIGELRRELWRDFGRLTLPLPAAHEPAAHRCLPAIHPDHAGKRDALVETLYRLHLSGKPCLVCLRRVSDAEDLARRLAERKVKCQFLNPRQIAGVDASVQAIALPGQISLTLNLDVCGMDLPSPQTEAPPADEADAIVESGDRDDPPELRAAAGLRVLQFEAQELSRQDRRIQQLVGRHGRCGVVRQYLALDDDLFRYHLPAWCRTLHTVTANRAPGMLPRLTGLLLRYAQHRAEHQARRQRGMQPRREAQLNQQLAFAGDRDMDVGAQQFGKH